MYSYKQEKNHPKTIIKTEIELSYDPYYETKTILRYVELQ